MMEINYPIVVLVLIAVGGLIIYLIRKNRKDKKKFEKETIQSELKPEKHDSDHV